MPRSSKVVKLAQPGYDVNTAGDENLIYNSNWPLLKIVASGTFETTDTATEFQIICEHKLGYPPAFWWFGNMDDTSLNTAEKSKYNTGIAVNVGMDEKALYLCTPPGTAFGHIKIEWYIFALDLTKNYTAPQIRVGGVANAESDVKFKIAKPGKSITSNNLDDFVIHSDTRSPLIHSVTNGVATADGSSPTGFSLTATHNLGYEPMMMVYRYESLTNTARYFYHPYIVSLNDGGGSDYFIVDDKKVEWAALEGDKVSARMAIVILKDPFIIDYTVKVSI